MTYTETFKLYQTGHCDKIKGEQITKLRKNMEALNTGEHNDKRN